MAGNVLLSREALQDELAQFLEDQIGLTRNKNTGDVFDFESDIMVRQCNFDLRKLLSSQAAHDVQGDLLDLQVYETQGITAKQLTDLVWARLNPEEKDSSADTPTRMAHVA